jgi:hypothetical protein
VGEYGASRRFPLHLVALVAQSLVERAQLRPLFFLCKKISKNKQHTSHVPKRLLYSSSEKVATSGIETPCLRIDLRQVRDVGLESATCRKLSSSVSTFLEWHSPRRNERAPWGSEPSGRRSAETQSRGSLCQCDQRSLALQWLGVVPCYGELLLLKHR